MNISQMKDSASANGGGVGASSGGGATTTIPSLKRTLSGGAASSSGHAIGVGPPNLASHLGVGMNAIPSVLHASPSTGPPQMLRAVTSSGVYNRPGSNLSGNRSGASGGGSGSSSGVGSATAVPTMTTRSVTQSSAASSATMQDWRMYLTIEERQAVRSKIRDAYSSRCMSYEDLLQVACAIEEELLHISAPSRLDYFKSGFEFENRVKLKKDQLQGQLAALDNKRRPNTSPQPTGSNGNSPNSTHETPSSSSYPKKPRT